MDFKGKCIIFCAPSGSGKTTIVKHLLSTHDNVGFSISACTRPKRKNEINGKDYYFLTVGEFKDNITKNNFVEWEEVYEDNFYGTLKTEVQRLWAEGKHVLFDVDVKGGVKLKKYFGDDALAVFVKVPSMKELEERLRSRGTDSEESIERRLEKMEFEMNFEHEFDVTLVNDRLEESFKKADELMLNISSVET